MSNNIFLSGVIPIPTPHGPHFLLAQKIWKKRAVPLLHKIGPPDARAWWQGGTAYPLFESTLCYWSTHYNDQAGAQNGKIESPTPMPRYESKDLQSGTGEAQGVKSL